MNCYVHAVSAFRYFGHVTDNETHQAIVGAVVSLNNGTYFAPTDQFGRFEIKNLPPSDYSVKYPCLGFVSLVDSIKIDQDHEVSISLNAATVSLSEITVARGKGLTQSLNVSDIDLALRPVASSQDFCVWFPDCSLRSMPAEEKRNKYFAWIRLWSWNRLLYIRGWNAGKHGVACAWTRLCWFSFCHSGNHWSAASIQRPVHYEIRRLLPPQVPESFYKNTLKKNELKAEAGFWYI